MANITLIGMPACGKSTIGKILAKKLDMNFLDGDDILREKSGGKSLQEIITEIGDEGFREYEDKCLSEIACDNTVIAPGGSVCYAKNGVRNLRNISKVIYIEVPFGDIVNRIGDIKKRGVTLGSGMTLGDLYQDRHVKYLCQSHETVLSGNKSAEEIADEIAKLI